MQEAITINEAFLKTKSSMSKIYDDSEAKAIAHLLLENITGWSKLQRLTNKDQLLSPNQFQILNNSIVRLTKGEPLQYVLGEQYFMGLNFTVNSSVLIPRPETEELVQWIIDDNQSRQTCSIIDIGTGSGCIPISLKNKMKSAFITAVDLSVDALKVAKQNALKNKVLIDFLELDFLVEINWFQLNKFDVIVSNPPYIPWAEQAMLHQNVRDYEPTMALFVADEDPLIFYKKLVAFGKQHLNELGSIYCEIHQDFSEATKAVFLENGYKQVEIKKDIFGNPRMIKACV